ncbi:Hsp20/alpha crystallin family protein [Mycolicibacterium mengxianglii]|uniref:Hsp20/alpha crystallin family protein n=1 Tax=Mycolicibacterium mengxianglii TaxID=2736649 RepID=UPI0018EEE68C|nr:Hsp20/alpha crystallin family protein [Mycolicibacterium mengxianglii]
MSRNQMTLWSRPAWNPERWAREFFGPAAAEEWFKQLPADFNPAAEIVKDGEDALVRVELPGIDVDKDVTVEIENGQLVIQGERRDERSEESEGRTLREVRYGSFRRSFALPEHVTEENISATYDAGVLAIRVAGAHAKPAVPDAKRIAIESK